MERTDQDRKGRLVIGYAPFESVGNDYTKNFKRLLSAFGEVVPPVDVKRFLTQRRHRRFDVIVFNWSDNGIVGRDGRISIVGICKEIVRVACARLLARRLVFVRHNVYPHRTLASRARLAAFLVGIYERLFDLVWVHSGHMAGKRRTYIPHPLYQAGNVAPAAEPDLPEDFYIIFGRILPYKKIERFLEALPADRHVLVCGSCESQAYLEKLQAYAAPNVLIRPGFLSEERAASLVRAARALVITHADDDMIVSGSAIYALSLGVPVITVASPFVHWFNGEINPHSLFEVPGFSDLPTSLAAFDAWLGSHDTQGVRQHFSDEEITRRIGESFARLGLS